MDDFFSKAKSLEEANRIMDRLEELIRSLGLMCVREKRLVSQFPPSVGITFNSVKMVMTMDHVQAKGTAMIVFSPFSTLFSQEGWLVHHAWHSLCDRKPSLDESRNLFEKEVDELKGQNQAKKSTQEREAQFRKF